MSVIVQEIPKIGLVMEEVKVVRWLKSVGDSVAAGEPLLEVETEKSVVEIEAAASGRLTRILLQADSVANVGTQVAWIESADTPERSGASSPRMADAKAAALTPTVPEASATPAPVPRDADRIRSSPVARKLALERGVDLGELAGSGPNGRVQLDDVRRAVSARSPAAAASPSLSPMRRALARAMTASHATIPQFTVTRAVEWTVLQELRGKFAAQLKDAGPKLSVNDFLLQAVARTLIEFPALNATFSGDAESADAAIVAMRGAHIGLVVAIDSGLLVPVIHDVEHLGLMEIARRRQDCVERSLLGRLKREELDAASFSISNLGADGPDRFTAIINPPQSAILAVGRQRDCVVARDGAVVVRSMSDLTLTVDHRVADGRLASQFIARLVAILEGRDWRLQ